MKNVDDNAPEIIETIDEDGNKLSLKLVDIVVVDEQEYALLLPADANENEDEEVETVLMRLKQDGEEYIFEAIDDDDEFDLVAQAIIDDSNEEDEEGEE